MGVVRPLRRVVLLLTCAAWLAAVDLLIDREFKARRRRVPSWFAAMLARARTDGEALRARAD